MASRGGVELREGHARAGDCAPGRGINLEPATCHVAEIHHHAFTDVAAAHGAACPARYQ